MITKETPKNETVYSLPSDAETGREVPIAELVDASTLDRLRELYQHLGVMQAGTESASTEPKPAIDQPSSTESEATYSQYGGLLIELAGGVIQIDEVPIDEIAAEVLPTTGENPIQPGEGSERAELDRSPRPENIERLKQLAAIWGNGSRIVKTSFGYPTTRGRKSGSSSSEASYFAALLAGEDKDTVEAIVADNQIPGNAVYIWRRDASEAGWFDMQATKPQAITEYGAVRTPHTDYDATTERVVDLLTMSAVDFANRSHHQSGRFGSAH